MIQLSEIMLGYTASEAVKSELLCLLNLASEMIKDRTLVIDRDGNVRYCVEDIRYITIEAELSLLSSKIPQSLTPRVKDLALNYLKSLYGSSDILIITK